MILAICSAPLQLRLHPVKSTIRILEEYLTLWQMTEIYENGSCENSTYSTIWRSSIWKESISVLDKKICNVHTL